jgi:hypothetical protein
MGDERVDGYTDFAAGHIVVTPGGHCLAYALDEAALYCQLRDGHSSSFAAIRVDALIELLAVVKVGSIVLQG